uniref:acetyl-CoA carboxylase carboxyltransferase beta subunit n=1 Tax=Bonnaya ciliata TaxID=2508690 RepID=UPI00257BC9DC|nr:acetyl-CoA carboxylase carboxyltransferase beta subunit [Bonnaya ciliata]WGV43008.1 acetyl-CoA carboxylase carboxyltransferase beta subunit [Bonnaya ciliata]
MTIHLLYFYANRGQENSMERCWFNSMVFKKEVERRYGIRKSTENLGPIQNTSQNEHLKRKDRAQNIPSWRDYNKSRYKNVDHFFRVKNIPNLISDDTFLVKDRNGNSYSIYFDIKNRIFEIDNNHSFRNELERFFYRYTKYGYINNGSTSEDSRYRPDTQSNWNNHLNSCIDGYLQSQICIDTSSVSDSSDSYISRCVFDKRRTSSERGRSKRRTRARSSDLTLRQWSNDFDIIPTRYRRLWRQCENCYELIYKSVLISNMFVCNHCGYHLKMRSSDRIETSIDPGTWDPMNEDMVSSDPLRFYSKGQVYKYNYKKIIDSAQRKTGLTEAIQTGIGQINGIPVAIGVMDFHFLGGSMGCVVGEKITRLVEYAANEFLPLIIVCASGGARMQEGTFSLMQMAKISSALYDYQSNKKLLYVSILTSPTTGGVTASFGMLGDLIIAEPNSYVAFAGKRVIEQTLNKALPEEVQAAEYLFQKGLFDLIVPRNLLKGVLSELFNLHAFFPLNSNSINK